MPARPRSVFSTLLLVLALSCVGVTMTDAQVRAPGPNDPWNVDDLRPGMRGYGLTVFRGTTPERFGVEVIDVLHNFRADMSVVLVRVDHPVLDEANTIGGMSGSPIFVEDRLVGAYAYGWPFGSQPIAGVTPATDMLRELRRVPRATSFPGAVPLGAPAPPDRASRRRPRASIEAPYLGLEPASAFAGIERAARRMAPQFASSATLVPASTPMLVGGLDPASIALLAEQLSPLGIDVQQAGGGSMATPPSPPPQFVNGGALAVLLARGDVTIDSVGTVTWVDGDRLVAFGHPMVEGGETGLPTGVARVMHVVRSVQRSFKLAEAIAPLGTLIEDRQSAIVVDTSLVPATFPMRVRIAGVPDAHRTEWNVIAASHRAFTPLVVATVVGSAVKAVASDNAYTTFEATSRVWIDGLSEPVSVVDRGFSATGPSVNSALHQLRAFDLVEAAYGNPFVDSRVTRMEIDLAVRFVRETAEIVDVSVDSIEVDPGSRVNVRVVLHPYGRYEEVRLVPVEIPESAAGQTLQVIVEAGGDVTIERPEPRTLEDVIAAIRDRYPRTSLVVQLRSAHDRGLSMGGHVVRSLPRSALDALTPMAGGERARAFLSTARHEVPMGLVLSGGARVDLQVRAVARSTR